MLPVESRKRIAIPTCFFASVENYHSIVIVKERFILDQCPLDVFATDAHSSCSLMKRFASVMQ
jgi:hypothetical protein